MPNPQKQDIILVDKTEVDTDRYGSYLKIYDMVGNTFRLAEKRSNLWDIFRNARKAEPILTTFETYKNKEYIADARSITDEILKQAVQNQGMKLVDAQNEERTRSQAISYSKDLCCAGKIEIDSLFDKAREIYIFIKGL